MDNIKTFIPAKQCDAYYEALKNNDGVAAHMLYIEPYYKSFEQIQSEIRFKRIVDEFEARMKYIEDTPNDILLIETEMRLNKK